MCAPCWSAGAPAAVRRVITAVAGIPMRELQIVGRCPFCDFGVIRSNTLDCYACPSCWWWATTQDVERFGIWWLR